MGKAIDALKRVKDSIIYDGNIFEWTPEYKIIKQELKEGQEAKETLEYYKTAFEMACKRLSGNPQEEILEQAIAYVDFHKEANEKRLKLVNKIKEMKD